MATATDRWCIGPQISYCHRPVACWATNFLLPPTSATFDHKVPIAIDRWHVGPQASHCHQLVASWTTNLLLPPTGGELDHKPPIATEWNLASWTTMKLLLPFATNRWWQCRATATNWLMPAHIHIIAKNACLMYH